MAATLNSILDRAVMVVVHIRQWGATQKDRESESELHEMHGVDGGSYYDVTRSLISREHLLPIQRIAGRIRKYVAANSMPWTDDNGRLVATELLQSFVIGLDDLKEQFDEAVEILCEPDNLAQVYATSELVKSGQIAIEDLPDPEWVRSRFYIDCRVRPIPSGKDFRVHMSKDLMDAIKQDCEDNLREAATEATIHAFGKVKVTVNKMIEGMKRHGQPGNGKKPLTLNRVTVENVVNLVDVLDELNIANDPDLTRITAELRRDITAWDVDMLKDDPELRQAVTESAEKILGDVDASVNKLSTIWG